MDPTRRPITRLSRIAGTFAMTQVGETGVDLTPPEIHAIRHITRSGGCSQATLAQRLGVDKAAVTRTLRSLEEKGYVRREPDPEDKRVKRVFVTEKAAAVKDEVLVGETLFYEWLMSELPPQQRQQFSDTLASLVERAADQRHRGYPDVRAYQLSHREDTET